MAAISSTSKFPFINLLREKRDAVKPGSRTLLTRPGMREHFDRVIEKVENLLETRFDPQEAKEAFFLFETARMDCPRPLTHKSVQSNSKERDALMLKIIAFIERILIADKNGEGRTISIREEWFFRDETVALVNAMKNTEKMEVLGIDIEYSVHE